VTQNLTFREQLEAGIRYFDLRVSSKPGDADQEIYFIHGLFGIKVWDGLMEIDAFLTQHPQEIVFLDFNHFYAMDEAHHKCLILQIQEAFGNKLCPTCSVESMTLRTLWEKKCQVGGKERGTSRGKNLTLCLSCVAICTIAQHWAQRLKEWIVGTLNTSRLDPEL
jgi:hypothetical protein